jgi:acyl-CoA thioesterase FadM
MLSEPVTTEVQVRPNDLDRLGHVNNAVAVEYLEAGRWDWAFRRLGATSAHVVPVVARLEVDYRRELGPGTVVVTTTLTSDVEDSTFQAVFVQSITQDEVAVRARVQVAFLDVRRRVPTTMQAYLGLEDP